MSKKSSEYICVSCGSEFSKWSGKCPRCGEWNSVTEIEAGNIRKNKNNKIISLSDIDYNELSRIKTNIDEFNTVCGGGIIPGSIILISGEPGIGKSTLALQIAAGFKTLYVSGEESPVQLKHRSYRLGIDSGSIMVLSNTCVEDIIRAAETEKPELIIADSVQTLYSSEIPGSAGSVVQIRESSAKLMEAAKSTGTPVALIGHITKEGSVAGPKILEHLVDTVLYFEGDFTRDYRMIRASKNRFGSVNEIGLFRMSEKGLIEVKDKNSLFLNLNSKPGSAVSAAVEGSRTILFEVQALVTYTHFSNPRRMSDGFDFNRLILLAAVLEKYGSVKLNSHDIFINVAGGFRINETPADLAVAMAVVSSLRNKPIPGNTGFLGEISLSGEIRQVSQFARRAQEFSRSGFERLIVPVNDATDAGTVFKKEIIGVKSVNEAINLIF